MTDHYCCKNCHMQYDKCVCVKFERKSVAQELKEEAKRIKKHKTSEDNAKYWLSVRAQGQKLCEEAIEEARATNISHKRSLGFGEIFDENVAKKLVELLKEEEFQVKLNYHEGNISSFLHDDRVSYWWVEISW